MHRRNRFDGGDLEAILYLLVRLCRRDLAPTELAEPALRWLGPDDARTAFLWLAREHRVQGLVLRSLDTGGLLDGLPAPACAELRSLLRAERRRTALLGIELERLASMLHATEIHAVALKGGSLRDAVYADPVERFLSDFDLLVAPVDVDRSIEVLAAAGYENRWSAEALRGYREYHYHIPLHHRSGYVAEIHWSLSKPGRPYRLDPAAVLRASRSRAGPTSRLATPSPEHLLLHTALQQVQDGLAYLARSVDLDRITASFPLDWDAVARSAVDGRLGPATALTLQLSHRLLGASFPGELVRRIGPGFFARNHLALLQPVRSTLRQRFHSHPTAHNLFRLWLLTNVASRVSEVWRMLFAYAERPAHRPWEIQRGPRFRLTAWRGPWSLLKLGALQLGVYLDALRTSSTRGGRSQMRFWSSHLSSSERL